MEITVEPSKTYAVTTSGSCTVTDADGLELCTASSGSQAFFVATTPTVTISDDGAKVSRATFNYALAVAGLLGGGDKLPAGYTRLEFLENTTRQTYIITDYYQSSAEAELSADCAALSGGSAYTSVCALVPVANGCPWGFGFRASGNANYSPFSVVNLYEVSIPVLGKRCLFKLNASSLLVDGAQGSRIHYGGWSTAQSWHTAKPLWLFCAPHTDVGTPPSGHIFRAYRFTASLSGKIQRDFIPALDPTGTPCMFDIVTRKPFYNSGSGQFIAGLTLAQAAQLGRKLPSAGGSLTISLPEGYDLTEDVINSLALAESQGWVLTIQTYAAQTAAATFALRRVWVRRVLDENGSYVAADGSRWQVEWCVDVIGADPEAMGYERFRSVDAAVAYWELEPYQYPEEELSTIE